jgi:hypothetical protein
MLSIKKQLCFNDSNFVTGNGIEIESLMTVANVCDRTGPKCNVSLLKQRSFGNFWGRSGKVKFQVNKPAN